MQFGISEAVEHWGKYRPTFNAISYKDKNITYSQLNNSINLTCNYLKNKISDEQRIGLAVINKLNFLIGLLSILRLGKSAVVLNVGLPKEALVVNIQDTMIRSIIYDTNKITDIKHKQIVSFNIEGIQKQKELQFDFHTVNRQPSNEWGIVFSSGTTGIPKGIERDHNSIITELIGWCLELGLSKNSCFYIGRPIFYTGGLVLALSTLLVSGTIIINNFKDDNNPFEVWHDYKKTLERIDVDWSFFIPDQLRKFISIVKEEKICPNNSKFILTMGAPISGNEKQDVVKFLKSEIVESWGNSESLGTITDPEDVHSRPNSIGRPFLTDEMLIVDDNGDEIKVSEYGRIAGSEEAGFLKYSNRPIETERVKKHSLIISDDIGYIDQEGFFYVCGRRQDLIITKELTIFIPDLEERIRDHSFIDECCIITSTFNDGSYHLFAVIVPTADNRLTCPELKMALNTSVNNREKFKEVFIVDSLPKLPSGKIDKIKLTKKFIK